MEKLVEQLQSCVSFTEQELQLITHEFKKRSVKKGEKLLQAGDMCTEVYFINSGCFKLFTLRDGKEKVLQFFREEQSMTESVSFYQETPSVNFIEAIEYSEILVISKESVQRLYLQTYKLDKFVRLTMERNLTGLLERLNDIHILTNEELYLEFHKKYPEFSNRIPQYLIASFLGITPEGLSKIRKRLSKKKSLQFIS